MALYLDLEQGESLRIGQSTVRIESKTGKRVRLRIDGPEDVRQVKPGQPDSAPIQPFTRPRLSVAK
jgi:hypothetical protein